MNTLRRVARAVKVAIQSLPDAPAPIEKHERPGLDRQSYGEPAPSLDSLARKGNAWTGLHNGQTYHLFFLVGHPRSGTNWTSELLNLHPKISCTGEFRFEALRRGFDILEASPWHIAHHEPARSIAERSFEDAVRRIMLVTSTRRPQATWIGDRTPRALDCYLPGAPHILVIRDPRDVLVSWAHREFKDPGGNFLTEPFRTRLAGDREAFLANPGHFKQNPERLLGDLEWFHHLLRIWHGYTVHNQQQLRRLASGEALFPVHVVRYERLHETPETERAAMYRFLGLDPDEAAPINASEYSTPAFGRAGAEADRPGEFYRKGRVGDWKNYFTPAMKDHFKQHAGDLLIQLGYEKDGNW